LSCRYGSLLTELESAEKSEQRQRLLAQVKRGLEVHTKIEEEIFHLFARQTGALQTMAEFDKSSFSSPTKTAPEPRA
jgi:hypothetical protein